MAELITTNEFATMLGVHPQTIYLWRKAKYGPKPVWLSSNTLRYRLDDVDAWLKEREGLNDDQ